MIIRWLFIRIRRVYLQFLLYYYTWGVSLCPQCQHPKGGFELFHRQARGQFSAAYPIYFTNPRCRAYYNPNGPDSYRRAFDTK